MTAEIYPNFLGPEASTHYLWVDLRVSFTPSPSVGNRMKSENVKSIDIVIEDQ